MYCVAILALGLAFLSTLWIGSTVNIFGDEKSYDNTYGEGLNTIDITNMEGILNID